MGANDVSVNVPRPTDPSATALHKYAFRTAYEFLTEMWPPVNTEDYWTVAATKMKDRFNAAKQDYLAEHMLITVYKYLEQVVKNTTLEQTVEQEKANDEC